VARALAEVGHTVMIGPMLLQLRVDIKVGEGVRTGEARQADELIARRVQPPEPHARPRLWKGRSM
jgi:hypothetical protein